MRNSLLFSGALVCASMLTIAQPIQNITNQYFNQNLVKKSLNSSSNTTLNPQIPNKNITTGVQSTSFTQQLPSISNPLAPLPPTPSNYWCKATEATNAYIQANNLQAANANLVNYHQQQSQAWIQSHQPGVKAPPAVRTVPVVVHVVHNTNNPAENVSDAIIFDMINTLNEDFRANNPDISQVRAQFQADIADSEIEFCLASKDPSGNSTTGIVRVATTEDYYDPDTETNKMKSTSTGGADPWPGIDYLNIWVCDITNGAGFGTAGYAYLPTPGMHGSAIDGLVLDYDIGIGFGDRTATHEIGHYLGLQHTWGSNQNCSSDDGFGDTPDCDGPNYGCNFSDASCSSTDQIENYMDYANCPRMYTIEQAAYMNSILGGTRSSLLNSDGCEATAPPTASFTENVTTVVVGNYVNFTDQTSGLPSTWAWNFGGGGTPNTSTSQNVSVQWNTIGTYTVSLTASNALGSDDTIKTNLINVIAAPPPPVCGEPFVVWCEDFASGVPVSWSNTGTPAAALWEYRGPSTTPNNTVGGRGDCSNGVPISGPTASNGFMIFDSNYLDGDACSGAGGTGAAPAPHTGTLTTGAIDLSGLSNLTFEFYYFARDFSATMDLEISTNGGIVWTSIWEAGLGTNAFTNYDEVASIDISAQAGGQSDVRFRWVFDGGYYEWMIDDVKIIETPEYDASISDITDPSEYTLVPKKHITPIILEATISNLGSQPITDAGIKFNVHHSTLGNIVYSASSATTPSILPGGRTTVSVASYTPIDTGFYFTEYISRMDENDTVPTNDTAYGFVIITDSVYARDDGGLDGGLWGGTGSPFIFGQTFYAEQSDYVSSITAMTFGSNVGDTLKLQLYNFNNGVPTTLIGESNEYYITPSDTPVAVLTLPLNGGPFALLQDTFFIAIEAKNITGGTAIAYSDYNVTDGTVYGSVSGSGFVPFGGLYNEDFSNGIPPDMTLIDNDGLNPDPNISQFGFDGTDATAWVGYQNSIALSTSWYNPVGQSDDWIFTPAINLNSNSTLYWEAIAYDADYPDGYEVRISTTSPTVAGATANPALFTIGAEDTVWTSRNVDLAAAGYSNQTVYIAFRNNSNNMYLLGLDNIAVGTPSPLVEFAHTEPFVLRANMAECNVTLSASETPASCGLCDGQATVTAVTGISPFTYQWNDPSNQTTATATGLCAGSFDVLVTDANGCTATIGQVVTDAAAMTLTTSSTPENCGASNGTATVTITGGTTPHTVSWTGGGSTTSITGLSTGTFHVTVTDNNGCIVETDFFNAAVVADYQDTVNVSDISVNISCLGGNDGSIDISTFNGTSPYTYAWTGTGVTPTAEDQSGLSAGTYTVSITDNNGCTTDTTYTLTEPASLPSVTGTTNSNVSCLGGNNGEVSAASTGGTTPYTYAWDDSGNSTTQTVSGLPAGTFNVTLTDANGCTSTSSATITEPASGVSSSNTINQDVQCNGGNDGDATVNASGGTSPYSFIWPASAGSATTQNVTTLTAGSYDVTVTDDSSCTTIETVTIGEPALFTASTSSNPAACLMSDGDATVTGAGGTTAYSYQWDASAGSQTTATATGLSAGGYDVTLTDANMCQVTATATVNNPGAPSLSYSITPVNCNGDSTGDATVNIAGGTSPFNISWSDPMSQTTVTATGLAAGSYTVTVTGSDNCSSTEVVNVSEPTVLTPVVSGTNLTCFNDNSGTVDASSSTGGVTPYSYQWDDASNSTTASVSGLPSGTYSVTVTDGNGCDTIESVTIVEPIILVSTATLDNHVTCFGDSDGQVTGAGIGGTSPYTYQWNDLSNSTTSAVSGLSGGNYTVTVTDNNGCVSTSNVSVLEPTILGTSISSNDESAPGANDGDATVVVTGGTTPYTYLWDAAAGGQTTATATALSGGNYVVIITDSNGCTTTDTVTVGTGCALSIDSANVVNLLCNGDSTGTITLNVSGGTGSQTYSWSNGGSGSFQTGLSAGTYTVTATDGGCTDSDFFTVTEPSAISSSTASTDESSAGANDGTATVVASGGTTPYSYQWDAAAGGQTTSTATGLGAGTYYVTITDGNGCTSTDSVTVTTAVGIAQLGQGPIINIRPNPTAGPVTVDVVLSKADEIEIKVLNYLGQEMKLWKADAVKEISEVINTTGWSSGVYFFKVKTSNTVKTMKVIVK